MEAQQPQNNNLGSILGEELAHNDWKAAPEHARNNKRCCDCNCDCGQTLVNTFAEMVNEKLAPVYEMMHEHQRQLERVESLLMSVVSIKYPELKRKMGAGVGTPSASTVGAGTADVVDGLDAGDHSDTPKKRRRLYSHDISNKISTTLEPLFEDSWKISKEREREIGMKIAEDIGVEVCDGITIVKSFWHRSRGNSKRLYTQLDDYRMGCDLILKLDEEKRMEALARFKIETEDVLRNDIIELNKILDEMKKKGSGRTAVKGKKNLKKLPDIPIKTLKGRASYLSNHFYAMVQGSSLEALGSMEEASISPSVSPVHTHSLPLMGISLASPSSILNTSIPLTPITPSGLTG